MISCITVSSASSVGAAASTKTGSAGPALGVDRVQSRPRLHCARTPHFGNGCAAEGRQRYEAAQAAGRRRSALSSAKPATINR